MHEQQKEKLYILCGLSSGAGGDIRAALIEAAREEGYDAVCVSRYRKEGIRQYISEHPEFRVLVLQEAMQSSYPYTAEELSELMDDYHLNIVISIRKAHRANPYMKILYTAGILNALYEEDATAENILKCILYPRTRKECRAYYQITTSADAMRALDIVNEERMQGYLSYIEESQNDEEIVRKYRYVAKSLKIIENMYLVKHLSEHVKSVIASEEEYQRATELQDKKKGWFSGKREKSREKRKRPKIQAAEPFPRAPDREVAQEKQKPLEEDHAIEEMIDEDISDLLGFETEENPLNFMNEILAPDTVEEKEVKEEHSDIWENDGSEESIHGRELFLKVLALVGGMFFLAVVILFGFFLYSEHQAKETSVPVISQQQREDPENDMKESAKPTDDSPRTMTREWENQEDKKEETVQNSDETTKAREILDVQETAQEAGDSAQKNTSTATEASTTRGVEGREISNVFALSTQQPQEDRNTRTDTEEPATSVTVVERAPHSVENQEIDITSYQGKIFNGAEVVQIARKEENQGIRLYLRTREAGEGFFSADIIAQMVDDTCSYLAQGITEGQLSFIQQ